MQNPPAIDIAAVISSLIDPDDPTPAYHQVAAVVRWEVARGRIPLGTQLPPIRTLAEALALNYHTVRRAWGDLEREGVLTLRQGRGARVVRAPATLTGWRPSAASRAPIDGRATVWVADPVLERAARLATRLMARFDLVAVPYPLDGPPPPPGPVITLHDGAQRDGLLERWPGREGDLQVIEPVLDPVTIQTVRRNAQLLGVRDVAVVALGGDPAGEVADLLRQLPRVGLRAHRLEDGKPTAGGDQIVLHFPAAWQALDWQGRMHPRAMTVESEWAPGPLARVAKRLGWRTREE